MNSLLQLRNVPVGILQRRRFTRPAAKRPKVKDLAGLLDWTHGKAYAVGSPIKLIDGFAWRLVAAGLPVDRMALSVALLHPQFGGYGIRWWQESGVAEEVLI